MPPQETHSSGGGRKRRRSGQTAPSSGAAAAGGRKAPRRDADRPPQAEPGQAPAERRKRVKPIPYKACVSRAKSGDAESQWRLATLHYYGTGGAKRDLAKSLQLYTLAAGQGHSKALHDLACCHADGVPGFMPKNPKKAVKLWMEAAEKGLHAALPASLGGELPHGRAVFECPTAWRRMCGGNEQLRRRIR